MNRPPAQASELFGDIVARFAADPSVTPPELGRGRRFGSSALKVDGKIFAMRMGDELVVKLPRQRVDELVASGRGKPFESGRGRVMKEWVMVAVAEGREWSALADEARQFVAATTQA